MDEKYYLRKLQEKNFLEKIFLTYLKDRKTFRKYFYSIIAIALLIIFIPISFVKIHNKINKNTLEKEISIIQNLNNEISKEKKELNKNKLYYKDYNLFLENLDIENNKTKEILKKCKKINYKKKTFKENLNCIKKEFKQEENSVKNLKQKIISVKTITDEQIKLFKNVNTELTGFNSNYSELSNLNKDVQAKGKTNNIKNKANNILNNFNNIHNDLNKNFKSLIVITEKDKGKYTLNELLEIQNKNHKININLNNSIKYRNDFKNYYSLLLEQKFSIVTQNDYDRTTVYETEHNPLYKEWNEEEKYTDYETRYKEESYTERVYKGSRIVGNSKEDIYENVTKTKQVPYKVPVTKTRTVTKDNGKPRYIQVPYQQRTYYKIVTKTDLNGSRNEKIILCKKHAKWNSLYYSFNNQDKVGYCEWKQKYNDTIIKGFNLNPFIEK